MGNSQASRRAQYVFPSLSNYAHLPPSPSTQQLLGDTNLSDCNCSEKYETIVKDFLKKKASNDKKIAELEHKIEQVQGKNTSHVKRVAELDHKIERLIFSNKATDGSIREKTANEKKIAEREQKMEFLEHLLLSKNAAREGSFRELQAKVDGLILNVHEMELDKHVDEPEYVDRILGVILMLVFAVFVSIGLQL